MSEPATLTSNITGLQYEVYVESDDHLYVVNDGHVVLTCNIDDDVQTIVEDHERINL
jgi:hypothetical protein